MERTTITDAKLIFKDNFIGPEELRPFLQYISGDTELTISVPEIPWTKEILKSLSKDYLLVLGISEYNGHQITIRNLRNIFGIDPEKYEPCFYNQDWYIKESFIDTVLQSGWYLIRKNTLDSARGVDPNLLIEKEIKFPSAILCCYTFFAAWFAYKLKLWQYDFIWCCDRDHNDDLIYVGKYSDIDSVNKNGFSIHRHLALRPCYSAIDFIS